MALLTDCVITTSATKPVRLVVRPLQEVARSMSVLENADIFMVVVLPVQFEQWQLPVCLSLSLVYFFFFLTPCSSVSEERSHTLPHRLSFRITYAFRGSLTVFTGSRSVDVWLKLLSLLLVVFLRCGKTKLQTTLKLCMLNQTLHGCHC